MTINNNNIFGVFTLGEVRSGRLTGDWLNKEIVSNYGWFIGGKLNTLPDVLFSIIDRIDFSNDSVSASVRGSLLSGRLRAAATGNSNYGWIGGGKDAVSEGLTTVDRIDYSNEYSNTSNRGPLSSARGYIAATGNSNYGWFGGGLPSLTIVDRIDYSNDSSIASSRGPLNTPRGFLFGASGNSNYGWYGGGGDTGVSSVDRIDYSNDSSIASSRGPLTREKYGLNATGNSNYGWFGGGRVGAGGAGLSLLDRIDYSNDLTIASVRSPLNISRYSLAATGNSDYGWFGGGISPALLTPEYPTGLLSIVERINYSNDSNTASTRGALSANRAGLTATSGVLNIRRQKTGSYGWFAGGAWSGPTYSTVDRIDFSNDSTLTSQRSILTSARYLFAAIGTSDYGWFGGGGVTETVDRIDFSNDSSDALPRTSLSASRFGLAAVGNSNYGWFGGGGPATARVDRINYSNDLSSVSPRGVLSSARYNLAATGNSNYGWFGGGVTPTVTNRVDRINFSNDSVSASIRGPLSSTRQQLTATGNSNYGWFGGGVSPTSSPTTVAIVNRIDYSNDSSTASVRGVLSAARGYLAATGNSNYGWFSCGSPSSTPTTDRIDRINFSNDLSTASIRGASRISTFGQAATSNTSIG
jgi:hypothetical protein